MPRLAGLGAVLLAALVAAMLASTPMNDRWTRSSAAGAPTATASGGPAVLAWLGPARGEVSSVIGAQSLVPGQPGRSGARFAGCVQLPTKCSGNSDCSCSSCCGQWSGSSGICQPSC